MCGFVGVVAPVGGEPEVSRAHLEKMRDMMLHRGPDDAGLVERDNIMFAHRRLSIIDLEKGQQPMSSADGTLLVVYNGELYNDAELRQELEAQGVRFRTRCDTETIVEALRAWGPSAVERFRGMFALAAWDFRDKRLILARDPLGIKPLYYTLVESEIVFASDLPPLLAYPGVTPAPCWPAISWYLSSLRTTLGSRTLFDGIDTVMPGELLIVEPREGAAEIVRRTFWREPGASALLDATDEELARLVRDAIFDSVHRHRRSDVPQCILLSGGIDSSILAYVSRAIEPSADLQSWCAGDEADVGKDLTFARVMAQQVGARHHEVPVNRQSFESAWLELIAANGVPVGTANETAIYAVSAGLKQHATVALSGEGADELFAGYGLTTLCGMDQIHAQRPTELWPGGDAGRARYRQELQQAYGTTELGTMIDHYLRVMAAVPMAAKAKVLGPAAWRAADSDRGIFETLGSLVNQEGPELPDAERLLRVHRRINLTGLLGRLDTSTMLAAVEGRTPFADVRVAELALAIPLHRKVRVQRVADDGWSSAQRIMAEGRVKTKAVLRAAFERDLPREILDRPKTSFQLPFQSWLGPGLEALRTSHWAKATFRQEVLDALPAQAARNPTFAWPVLNLAMWGRRWWG